jgi:ornithine carbamoyltransferase
MNFLSLTALNSQQLKQLINYAILLKQHTLSGKRYTPLDGKTLAMIFEKSSTRTRVSFETGMFQLGGHAIFLSHQDCQLGRGEPFIDTAKTLSGMVDIISVRTFDHQQLEQFASAASVPVINSLTDYLHPCQLLADMQTFFEQRGDIAGSSVAWIGDGNNMCHSYINAARLFGFQLKISCPAQYLPDSSLLAANKEHVILCESPQQAVENAALVVTDTWASMGQESENAQRQISFSPFQVTPDLLDSAKDDVIFMHCLPAHDGEEISKGLLDDPRSVVWQEAGNRLHAQKALLIALVKGFAIIEQSLAQGAIADA